LTPPLDSYPGTQTYFGELAGHWARSKAPLPGAVGGE